MVVKLSDYAQMTSSERGATLGELMVSPRDTARLEAEVRALEQRYEMTSETMMQRVRSGVLDTADTARWLVLLAALGGK